MISQFFKVNVGILENIVLAGKMTGLKSIYQMSSNNVYSSANEMPWNESQIPIPSSVYGLSKQMAEALGAYVSRVSDIKVVNLRLARLFGYGERDTVVFTKYMKLALKKQQLEVWGTGATSIEYLYVRDVVDAIESAVRNDIPTGAYNVGCGRSFSVLEIAETINREAGNEQNLFIDSSKPEGNYHILMDSSKFAEATNWKPKWSLEEAVKEMISLYKKENNER
jgi:UDP-glucose 4-epimerase